MRRWALFVVAIATPLASSWGCTGDECLRNSDCPSAYLCGAGTCVLREAPEVGGEAGETAVVASGATSGTGGISGTGGVSGFGAASGSGGISGNAGQAGSSGNAGHDPGSAGGEAGVGGESGAAGAAGDGGMPAVIVLIGGSAGSLPIGGAL